MIKHKMIKQNATNSVKTTVQYNVRSNEHNELFSEFETSYISEETISSNNITDIHPFRRQGDNLEFL